MESRKPLQILALNHVSRMVSDLEASYRFYTEVLGFIPVKRPSSFEFEGAWLHSYGIGLHLIKGCPPARPKTINPKSCHISFQAASLADIEEGLVRQGIPYVKNQFFEDGVQVAQVFFHDPDNNMIEICNCDVLPVVPLKENELHVAVPAVLPPHTATTWPGPMLAGSHAGAAAATEARRAVSDAGSDDSMAAAFEPTSCLSYPTVAATAVAAAAPAGAADRLRHLHDELPYGSFSSSMSGVAMAGSGEPNGMQSITASELDEWSRIAAGGSSISSGGSGGNGGSRGGLGGYPLQRSSSSSLLLELKQPQYPRQHPHLQRHQQHQWARA